MTPQLQQAIRLLQLSTLELKSEIQDALESNPMLELIEDGEQREHAHTEAETRAAEGNTNTDDRDFQETTVDLKVDEIPNDLPVDSSWEDTYEPTNYSNSSGSFNDEDDRDIDSRNCEQESLQDHLLWQMRLTPMTEIDQAIATSIIDSVSDDGYLGDTVQAIWESLKDELEIDIEEVEAVLRCVQNFDPPGVAARDLRECLLIQISQLDPEIPWYQEAKAMVTSHFELLAERDFAQLKRKLKLNEDELREVVKFIHGLNPRPGNLVASGQAEYIVPDVYVRKINGSWHVSLNPDATPRLNINSMYASLIQRANRSADNTYMQGQLQEARWLIKSLQSRNETLMKVATCIVERQQGFLEQGEEGMKALVLHDVAEAVGMHESTISRITNKKYMHTPRGIFELKYFFSSHVSTASGGECSSTAIRALIKKMVAAEDPRKPLSDSKIAKILSDQGINVARRTVAKYRDALVIPPSNERKRLA